MSHSGDQGPQMIHSALVAIVGRVHRIDLRELERRSAREIWDAAGPALSEVLMRSSTTLTQVMAHYDGRPEPLPPKPDGAAWDRDFALGVDTLVRQHPSTGRVTDLAFMARLELRERSAAIQRLDPDRAPPRVVLATLDGARRRVRKSLTAVATMIATVEGLPSELSFSYELEASLGVRRAYARLRASIGEADAPSDEALHSRLRGVGTRIAMLVGRSLYQDLRVDDRFELRNLQARILAWLRTDTSAQEALIDGRRLWQDLAGFARVIAQVSHRQELLEHDARIITIASAALGKRAPDAAVPEALLERLRKLHGLDDEVDALVVSGAADVGPWQGPLERLHARFDRSNGPPAPPEHALRAGDLS